jgi:hypothetical protein
MLPDRIDPKPPVHIYRWDLDKTYLRTDFDTMRQLIRSALESAAEKRNIPGTAALLRELKAHGPQPNRVCIISGSPRQMRRRIEEKLHLDRVEWDELVLKPNLSNVLRGRFRAVRGQVGFKLPALFESRARLPAEAAETLFGDDAEADAFIYSLYADFIAGRVPRAALATILKEARAYPDEVERTLEAASKVEKADPVRRVFIHLDRRTPPVKFAGYGQRLVPIYNYFQASLVLMADGQMGAASVLRVAAEMAADYGYSIISLSNSLQDMVRRGFVVGDVARSLMEALGSENPLLNFLRPAPDIVAAVARRIASFGAPAPPPPQEKPIDYVALARTASPRTTPEEAEEGDGL